MSRVESPITVELRCSYFEGEDYVICNGTKFTVPEKDLDSGDLWFWIYLGIYCVLVIFAGFMSGLTLGMLSQDTTSLHVLGEAGSQRQKKYARRVLPIIRRKHLLLVTLVVANAAAVETMPICLDNITDPITAIVVSATAVLIFGEVIPQAICSRFGLAIGAILSPLVYFLMVVTFVVSYPISKLLDFILGENNATFYRRPELKILMDLHGREERKGESLLTKDEVNIIKSALDMHSKQVKDSIVPLNNVYMLSVDTVLDDNLLQELCSATHSRIPIFEGDRQHILGILLTKSLVKLLIDGKEERYPVAKLMEDPSCFRHVSYVEDSMPLFKLLKEFQVGNCHLAVVKRSTLQAARKTHQISSYGAFEENQQEVIGIITLEDVFEELLQGDILDESDLCNIMFSKMKCNPEYTTPPIKRSSSEDSLLTQGSLESQNIARKPEQIFKTL